MDELGEMNNIEFLPILLDSLLNKLNILIPIKIHEQMIRNIILQEDNKFSIENLKLLIVLTLPASK